MPRVFLTGGSGLIGGALLERLGARGDDVVALARSEGAAGALRARGAAEVVRGDVFDADALVRGMDGCEVVFHVAGINTLCPDDPDALMDVNVRGAATVVQAAARAGVGRVVYTSSAAALGEAHGTVGREDSPHRGSFLSVYERSKYEGELAALAAGREAGVEVVSVNPSSVQGPGRSGGTGRILIAYLNGRLPAFVDTNISLVDIGDCVEGHVLAAERGRPGERYVLNGATLAAREALAVVAGLTGVAGDRVRLLPRPVAMGAATALELGFRAARRSPPVCREMVRTLLHGHRYDGSRATRDLGLAYTPVEETLARTIAWAVDAGLVRRPLPAWRRPGRESAPVASGTEKEQPPVSEVHLMERHEDPDPGLPPEHEHPARPEQPDTGFAEGVDRKPDPPEEELEPDYARGIRTKPEPERHPRFSEGIEQEPDTPEKTVERRFSEGVEERPTSD